jgi:hypothetical protein
LAVNGRHPGETLTNLDPSKPLRVEAEAISRLPFDRLEIIQDGAVVAESSAREGRETQLQQEIGVKRSGWIAARVHSSTKTHAQTNVFAHTSPIYLRVPDTISGASRAGSSNPRSSIQQKNTH